MNRTGHSQWSLTRNTPSFSCPISGYANGFEPATQRLNVLFSQQCEELVNGMAEVDETAAIVRRLLIHSAGKFSQHL
jgi:hypothetical protein